jgi:hypothetical protein
MSRVSWATETNYPTSINTSTGQPNPWSGQPICVEPAGDFFTPNTGVAAPEINALFKDSFAASVYALSNGGHVAAQNWHPKVGGGVYWYSAAYDWSFGVWMLGGADNVLWTYGDESTPNTYVTSITTNNETFVTALAKDPTDGDRWYALLTGSGSSPTYNGPTVWQSLNHAAWSSLTPNTWAYSDLLSVVTPSAAGVLIGEPKVPTWTLSLMSQGSAPTLVGSGGNGEGGANRVFLAANAMAPAIATTVIALTSYSYSVSSNLTSWNNYPSPLPSGYLPRGLAWVPALGVFVLVANSTTNVSAWQSRDGLTWVRASAGFSLANTARSQGRQIVDVASVGDMIAGVTSASISGALTVDPTAGSIVVSVDGGASWSRVPTLAPAGGRIYSSGTQLAVCGMGDPLGAKFSFSSSSNLVTL